MKTETTFKITLIVLLTLSVNSCRTKQMDFFKSRTSERLTENITFQSKQNDIIASDRITFISDSGKHRYTLRIVPTDTFTFSLTNGFRGKALSIELDGVIQQNTKTKNQYKVAVEKESDLKYDARSRSTITEKITVKKTTKTSWLVLGIIICVVIVGVVLWGYKRFQVNF